MVLQTVDSEPASMQVPALTSQVEAEQAVLGAVLLDADAMGLAMAAGLQPEHFASLEHRTIWQAVRHAHAAGQDIGAVEIFTRLQESGEADRVGGLRYLNELVVMCQATKAAGTYAALVVDAASRRAALALAERLQSAANTKGPANEWLKSLLPIEQALGGIRSAQPRRPTIPLEWLSGTLDGLQAPPQLVEGVLTAGGMAMVFGEANSGKSYFAIHLGVCISLGVPFLGRRTERRAVVYVGAEGHWSVRMRVVADSIHYKRSPGRIGLIPSALNLMDPSADVDDLVDLVRLKAAELHEEVGLIIVDTVARVMAGGDENDAQDMGRLIAAGDRLRQHTGAAVLFIHHAGKDSARGARGHSSLRAALDTEILVTADESLRLHHAKVTKQRDLASKGETFSARLVPVDLGFDQWGNAVTACAVVGVDNPAGPTTTPRLKPAQLAVMAYMAGRDGGVRRPTVVEALEPQGVSRTNAYRAIAELILARLLADVGGLVYLPKDPPSQPSQGVP